MRVDDAGSYRVFADFKRSGEYHILAADLAVDGELDSRPLPAAQPAASTSDGYEVRLEDGGSKAGSERELGFTVTRGGEKVHVQDYLGAKGHLVALREGDLAYLHVHPVDGIAFTTEFPSEGRYRLFLQFKHEHKVHTAAFTEEVAR